jgi:O-antigen/teichoic acid export membrane protein
MSKLDGVEQKLSPKFLKMIGNTVWLLADKILRMICGLFVGIWVARYLGPNQFGLLNYAIAFAALFESVAKLGLDQIVIRDIVRHPSSKEQILGTVFGLKILGGIVSLLFAIGIVTLFRPTEPTTQILVGIFALGGIFQAFDTIEFWFQSQVQAKYPVWSRNAALIIATLGKILLIQSQASLFWFAALYVVEIIFAGLGFILVYRIQGYFLSAWRWSFSWAKRLLSDSWTIILSGFVIMIYMRTDQIMLGQMVGNQAVGIYSVAVRVSELLYILPTAITGSAYPSLIEARQVSEQLYYSRFKKLLNLMSCFSYLSAIGLSLGSVQLITLLFGRQYEAAGNILVVHIWTCLFVSSGLVRSLWTTTEGLMQFALVTTAIGAGINVGLNFLLIPHYEGLGAASATLIAQAFASYISGLFFKSTRKIFMLQTRALLMPNPMPILSQIGILR